MALEYRDIVAFLAVAQCQSYSRAAEKLNLAQSALSRRVQRLEQDLGIDLLERHPRGVRMTEAGRLLMTRAEKLHVEFHRIEQELKTFASSPPQEVSVAMPQGAARLFTTPVIASFYNRHPEVRLRIIERESAYNRESVLRGEADFALVYNAQPHEDLALVPLLHERILVVAPGPAVSKTIYPDLYDLDGLERLPLILPSLPHTYRSVISQASGRKDFSLNVIMEVNGFATSLEMVQKGLGYTISTFPPLQAAIERSEVICIPITSPSCEVTLSLVHRVDRPPRPILGDLQDIIQDVARSIEPSAYWRKADGAR
ncbi:LysR family transcriptional regulator [Pseudochelatococcus sp. B33]